MSETVLSFLLHLAAALVALAFGHFYITAQHD